MVRALGYRAHVMVSQVHVHICLQGSDRMQKVAKCRPGPAPKTTPDDRGLCTASGMMTATLNLMPYLPDCA